MSPQISIERLPKSRVECRAVFTEEERAKAEKDALASLAQSLKIPGFRPGKAPGDLVREKVEDDKLLEETVRMLLPSIMQTAAAEHKIAPILPPNAAIEKSSPLTVLLTFVERPTVSVKANKIKVDKKEPKIENADLDRMIGSLLTEHQTAVTVDRTARSGDRLTLDVRGEDEAGKLIPGSELQSRPVVIGSKSLIPGFEDALIGLKAGDSKSFPLKFPEKYHAEHLQGKPVTFHVAVQKVEEVTTPKLTDAFAKEKLRAESAEKLRSDIHTAMLEQEQQIERQRREGALFEAILKATHADLAEELIADEERSLLEDFAASLKEQKLTLEQWLSKSGKTQEKLIEEFHKRAQDRLTLRLGIQQLIQDKAVAVSDEEMQQAIRELMAPLEADKRLELAPLYAKGERNYEQLKWQKTVEKLMEEMLT